MGFRLWVRDHFVTADAVYGLILYAAIVGAVSDDDSDSLEVLIFSVVSLFIFWGAHVFAGTIATHGVKGGTETTLGHAIARSIGHSAGMLYAAILPSFVLLLGVFQVLGTDDAVSLALLVAMVILGVLGYQAFAQRGSPVIVRILGAVGTALFGLLMIVLNIAVH
jgi:predicted anti-sigma-YlaC factor YlaD